MSYRFHFSLYGVDWFKRGTVGTGLLICEAYHPRSVSQSTREIVEVGMCAKKVKVIRLEKMYNDGTGCCIDRLGTGSGAKQ